MLLESSAILTSPFRSSLSAGQNCNRRTLKAQGVRGSRAHCHSTRLFTQPLYEKCSQKLHETTHTCQYHYSNLISITELHVALQSSTKGSPSRAKSCPNDQYPPKVCAPHKTLLTSSKSCELGFVPSYMRSAEKRASPGKGRVPRACITNDPVRQIETLEAPRQASGLSLKERDT